MRVQVGKGIERDVDLSKLSDAVREHVMYMGLRNILMDSHANHTKESGDDYVAQSEATVQRKLESLYAGEVRAAGTRSSDPIAVQMRALAAQHAKKALRASGKKLRDIESAELTTETNKILEKNEVALRKIATKMVEAAQALKIDVEGVV